MCMFACFPEHFSIRFLKRFRAQAQIAKIKDVLRKCWISHDLGATCHAPASSKYHIQRMQQYLPMLELW